MCTRTVNWSDQLSYWCSGTLIFLECSSMLNTAPVTNTFLTYTWRSKCLFLWWFFFFYILTKFLFYRLFDNALMRTYSLCGDKKSFNEMKICGVIANKRILFIERFFLLSQKMNRVSCLPFPLYITNHKRIKFLKTFRNLHKILVIEMC